MLSWVEHEKSFITKGPGLLRVEVIRIHTEMFDNNPPSTGWIVPFTIVERSLKRYIIGPTHSSTSQNLPMGVSDLSRPDLVGSLQCSIPMSVRSTVGLTEFTRIWCGPSSCAYCLVTMSNAAFEILYPMMCFIGLTLLILKRNKQEIKSN